MVKRKGCKTGESRARVLASLKANPYTTRAKIVAELNVTVETVQRNLRILKELGQIRRVGPDIGGHWKVIEKEEE